MTNGKMVHLRISSGVYTELKKAEKDLCFDSVQGMIKDLLRNFVLEMRRKEALEWLKKNKGKLKGKINHPTNEERELLLKQFLEKRKP